MQKVRVFKKSSRDEIAWQKYLKCDKIPDTNIPSDVRSVFYQWRVTLTEHWDQQINWWLKCNDRSVLTQDPSSEDERRVLIKQRREKTGHFYDVMTRVLLKIYNSLMDSLRRRKMTEARYEDLLTVELLHLHAKAFVISNCVCVSDPR